MAHRPFKPASKGAFLQVYLSPDASDHVCRRKRLRSRACGLRQQCAQRDIPRYGLLLLYNMCYLPTPTHTFYAGVQIYMCFHAVSYLQSGRRFQKEYNTSNTRHKIIYMAISFALLFCLTVSTAVNYLYGQHMWIDDRNAPGGPTAVYIGDNAVWFNTFGSATSVTQNAIADGLLVRSSIVHRHIHSCELTQLFWFHPCVKLYRCYVFWEYRIWIIILPACVYLTSIGKHGI